MPLARINIQKGVYSAESKRAIADAVLDALIEHLKIPEYDRYQLINEYDAENFIHTDRFDDIEYTDGLIVLEISFIAGRSDDIKRALLRGINERLVKAGIRSDDVFCNFYEVGPANVSFGRGLAQRAPAFAE
jgi:phenylpyruvate tautomerase PptA (4-oxalocrotonate tautomerase family)